MDVLTRTRELNGRMEIYAFALIAQWYWYSRIPPDTRDDNIQEGARE